MANVRLNLVVAACNNRGIGVKGQLPWRLKKDMQFFKNVTTETKDPDKQNAVIMGRITYFSIPEKFRPLAKRKNIILSRELKEAPPNTSLVRSLDEAVSLATGSGELADKIESVFIIGGGLVYKEAMESNYNCRIYLTRVLADIDCDTFFPELDENLYRKVDCEDVPTSVFTENGLDFKFEVYDKRNRTFNICAAMCSNRGIGLRNGLPWPSLRGDYVHYINLTSKPLKEGHKCARIKGRLTWISTSESERSDPNVINIAISKNNVDSIDGDKYLHKVVHTLNEAIDFILQKPTNDIVDNIWIMGGQKLYEEAVLHPLCRRIYLTVISGDFQCDTYFPQFENYFNEISDPLIDNSIKEDNDIQYQFKVYERIS